MSDTTDTTTHNHGEGDGNTQHPPPASRNRNWIWTWNNYTENDMKEVKTWSEAECEQCTIAMEVGEEGTPHLQGCWIFKNARTFASLKKLWPLMHLEKARNKKAALEYCRKEDTNVGQLVEKGVCEKVADPLLGLKLHDWQQELIDYIATKPDSRTIRWYYDPVGNCGKTSLAKHLCIKHDNEILYLSGGPSAIKYGIMSFLYDKVKGKLVRNDNNLRAAIFDFTRSQDERVSYQGLEEVKNGIFFNTKYECKQIVFNCPHVICFANFEPDVEKLSIDRWVIKQISDELE